MAAGERSGDELLVTDVRFESIDGEELALDEVVDAWRDGLPIELRPLAPDALSGRSDTLDEQVAIRLVEVLTRYPAFVPALDAAQRDDLLIDVLGATEGDRMGLEIALALEGLGQDAVASLVERLGARGDDAVDAGRVEALVSYLLDDQESRATVAAAIGRWPDDGVAAVRKARVAPYFDDDERRLAGLPEEGGGGAPGDGPA
jgi:hypothetical protein